MAYYTITINSLKRNNFNFGLNDYPIYDENHREELNKHILTHYLMREIGFETAELFKVYLNQKMWEIMPRYNVLYNAQLKAMENIFDNIDLIENSQTEVDRDVTNDTLSTTDSTSQNIVNSDNKELYQDTPQGKLKSTTFEEQEYATNLTLNKNGTQSDANVLGHTNLNGTASEDSVTKYYRRITGNKGNKYAIELLDNVRSSIKNIDEMIIKELDELFMQIY